MPEPLALPEIARSLRSLGTPRDEPGAAAHDAVFTPLLDARSAASDVAMALSTFAGETLASTIEARVSAAAQVRASGPADARARSALALECVEQLRLELMRLDRLGHEVHRGDLDAASGERWVEQLRRVFVEADRACGRLASVLADTSAGRPLSRPWFGR